MQDDAEPPNEIRKLDSNILRKWLEFSCDLTAAVISIVQRLIHRSRTGSVPKVFQNLRFRFEKRRYLASNF
jgi:hypothetical protein